MFLLLQLGLLFILLILLLLFQEGRSLQNFLLLLGTEDRVRVVGSAGVSLALGESPVAVSVCLVSCVFTLCRLRVSDGRQQRHRHGVSGGLSCISCVTDSVLL